METRSFRWLYIDFNSYFASVEQQLNPAYRGKPLAVVPISHDSSCVIAASYEAKAFGIKTGTPIYEAKRLCPSLICVLGNHDTYVDFHNKLLVEVENHLPISKVCSIDEMACELMDNESTLAAATRLAHKIKQGIAQHVGAHIRCSIGVAPNCYLAKVATDMQKPDGLTFIALEELPQKLYSLKLRDFPGIGPNMEKRLHRQSIWTVEQLCQLDLQQMRKAWGGVWGERMWHFLRGVNLPDEPTRRTSLGHSQVLAPALRSPEQAKLVGVRLIQKCAARLRAEHLVASALTLILTDEQGESFSRSAKCWQICDNQTFLRLYEQLWQALHPLPLRIKKIALTLTQLEAVSTEQYEFLEKPKEQSRAEKMSQALDAICERYGRDAILLGILPSQGKQFSETKVAFTHIPED